MLFEFKIYDREIIKSNKSHITSNSAHSSLFNNKADTNHTHSNMESRITALEDELLDLEEDLLS